MWVHLANQNEVAYNKIMKFEDLSIDGSLKQSIVRMGYTQLMPIQAAVIPILLAHTSCVVQSRTGSGKTLAYGIGMEQDLVIDQHDPQALVLAPTRELSMQIEKELALLGTYKKVKCVTLIGKQSFDLQKEDLAQRTHIVVGTPGRVYDHMVQDSFSYEKIKYFVLDEADALLNTDFIERIEWIMDHLQPETIVLVSATIGPSVQAFVQKHMKGAPVIHVDPTNHQIASYRIMVADANKPATCLEVLQKELPDTCIIFCATKDRVDALYEYLSLYGISVFRMHAGMEQSQRKETLQAFEQGRVRILIATDILARGIDIEKVDLVINYDQPDSKIIYTHRIGRSGRIYEKGKAITFIEPGQTYDHAMPLWTSDVDLAPWRLAVLTSSHRKRENKDAKVREDVMKIYITAGKSKKIRPGDIVGALCAIDGMTMDDIGVIQVQDHQSFVDILHNKGHLVLKNLHQVKKKHVRVERARSEE